MTTAFKLENIRRRYGKAVAVDGLSLSVLQGEVYGFSGRNGAGKTTTLRILVGIVRPDAGSIELLGKRIKRVTVSLKQRIGYVSQEPLFYSWMTAEQLGRFVSSFYPTWVKQEYSRLLGALDESIANQNVCFQPGIGTKGIVIYEPPNCLPPDSAAEDTATRHEYLNIGAQRRRSTVAKISAARSMLELCAATLWIWA